MMRKVIMILLILAIAFISLMVIFGLKRPFDNEITQDRPLIKWLCEQQTGCRTAKGPYPCSEQIGSDTYNTLQRWKGFHGCNNLTPGFENGYINIEACVCGGLM